MLLETEYVQTFRDVSDSYKVDNPTAIVLDEMNSFDAEVLVHEAPHASWEAWCSIDVYETSEMWWGRIVGFDAGRVVHGPMLNKEFVLTVPALTSHEGHIEKFVANYPPLVWKRKMEELRANR